MSPEASPSSPLRRPELWLVVALAAVLMLPAVGHRLIPTSHEARFALIARDMLDRHVWFDAHVRDTPYRNKPPLHPWTIVTASWWTGRVTEGSARLPGALATVATVAGVFLLADRLFHGRAGPMAGLVMATSYGVFAHSQMILPDMLMIAFHVFAGLCFWLSQTGRPGALVGFYAMLALGGFVKGPATLLPLAVAAAWLWTQHGARGLRTLWSVPGVAVFAAVTLVWVIPFATQGQSERFVGGVLWRDWLYHYFRAPRPGAIGRQLVELLVGFMPWTLLAPLAIVHAVRTRTEPAVRFATLWFVVQLALIMAATSQRVRYLLALYPGAALLVAWWAADDRRPRRPHRILAVAGVLVVAGVLAATALANPLPPREVAPGVAWILPSAGLVTLLLAMALGLWSGHTVRLVAGMALGMALALGGSLWPYDRWINRTHDFRSLAATVERHAAGGAVGVFVSKGEYLQIDFYLGRHLRPLASPAELEAFAKRGDRPVVVINQENWQRWRGELPADLDVLEEPTVARETLRLVRLRPARPRT
jgi:4-amino-4-deoxy-L-arabinose transferase-like glycosyltransferase